MSEVKDETEQRLLLERNQLKIQLDEKQKEYDEYRRTKQDALKRELDGKYAGKIIRIRQHWRGITPSENAELLYNYYFLYVFETKYRWESESEFMGKILNIDMQPDGFNVADNLTCKEYNKMNMYTCGTKLCRVRDRDIEQIYTREEVNDVLRRVKEAQDEMIKWFFEEKLE